MAGDQSRLDAPKPETREVLCTHCDRSIDIPATAMSVNCRHCHRRVIIEDIRIKSYHAVMRLATAGLVEVTKRAQIVAQVRVNDLVVEGGVKGDVTAVGSISIGKKGWIQGDVNCRTLIVQPGAGLNGFYRVDPTFTPEPTTAEVEQEDEFL